MLTDDLIRDALSKDDKAAQGSAGNADGERRRRRREDEHETQD